MLSMTTNFYYVYFKEVVLNKASFHPIPQENTKLQS